MQPDTEAVMAKIEALSPPDQLRLAASLLENQKPELAKAIIDRIAGELSLVIPNRSPRVMSGVPFRMPCPVCLKELPRPKIGPLGRQDEATSPSHYRRRADDRVDVEHEDGSRCIINRGVYDHLVRETKRAEIGSEELDHARECLRSPR